MLRENKLSILANLVLVMLMSSSICQTLYTSLFMTTDLSLTIFIMVIPLTLLFFIMFRNKKTTLVSGIIFCVISIIGILYIIYFIGLKNAGNWLYNYYNWFIDVYNGFYDGFSYLYTNIILISIAFIVTLLVYIFSMKFYNFYVLTVLFFSIFFVQLLLDVFVSNISFIIFLFSFLLYYFFDILKKRSKELTYNIGNKLLYLICILPVCLLVIAFSLSLPINEDRIEIPWLDSKINYIVDYIRDSERSDFDYFSFKSTGFGNNGRLGGNLKPSKTHVLNVKSESSKLYLKASSKPFYNGCSWYDDNEQLTQLGASRYNYTIQINQDSEEFNNGMFIETGSLKNDKIFKSSKAEIEFVNLKTKSIFIPSKVNSLTLDGNNTLFSDNEQMISSSDKKKKGFSYSSEYNNLILSSDDLKTLLRKSYKGYYSDLLKKWYQAENSYTIYDMTSFVRNSYTENISIKSSEKIISTKEMQDLITKADSINKRYTQLPFLITERVKNLAKDLTKDCNNNYDKAKAIETYLSSTYTYTLSPGTPPRNQDFVDYFLFEGKKGYCTYYATAMVVLLRCIGIPSRYVEGYVMPPTAENGVYKVTNEQAHAWVEVYFEGFGWIPFEPTATFVAKMYYDTTITSQSYNDDMQNSGYKSYLEYLEMMERNKNNASNSYDVDNLDTTTTETKSNNVFLVLIIVLIIIGITLLAFAILVLTNIIKSYCTMRRIRKAQPNSSVLLAYNYILKVLSIQNIFYNPAETPNEFGKRVEKIFNFKSYSFNKINFITVSNYYIAARYSKALLSEKDKQAMIDFLDILIELTIERIGKFKFIKAKFIFGKI